MNKLVGGRKRSQMCGIWTASSQHQYFRSCGAEAAPLRSIFKIVPPPGFCRNPLKTLNMWKVKNSIPRDNRFCFCCGSERKRWTSASRVHCMLIIVRKKGKVSKSWGKQEASLQKAAAAALISIRLVLLRGGWLSLQASGGLMPAPLFLWLWSDELQLRKQSGRGAFQGSIRAQVTTNPKGVHFQIGQSTGAVFFNQCAVGGGQVFCGKLFKNGFNVVNTWLYSGNLHSDDSFLVNLGL